MTISGRGVTATDFTSNGNLDALAGIAAAPPLESLDVAISSAEVLSLHSTPITLVPAPGANKAIIFYGLVLFLDYNSAAYADIAAGDNLQIGYDGGDLVLIMETATFLAATSDQYLYAPHYATATAMDVNPSVNAALEISLGGAVTTGNSPIGARIFYRTVDLSTLSAT